MLTFITLILTYFKDGLPQINPIKVTTATEGTFCSIRCLDYPGCNSFAYLNYTSSENCLLSSSVDGASVSGASGVVEIYKKAAVDVAKVSLRCFCNPLVSHPPPLNNPSSFFKQKTYFCTGTVNKRDAHPENIENSRLAGKCNFLNFMAPN